MQFKKILASILVCSMIGTLPLNALADGRDYRKTDRGDRRDYRHHERVRVGHDDYYVRSGRFFRPGPSGLISVRAPIGAIVATLPLGFAAVAIGMNTYFHAEGTYYSRVPRGYMVVEAPVVVAPRPARSEGRSGAVIVETSLLNVRSGPGAHFAISGQVRRGDALWVRGRSDGWYYVETPGGNYGWVMMQFTSPGAAG